MLELQRSEFIYRTFEIRMIHWNFERLKIA